MLRTLTALVVLLSASIAGAGQAYPVRNTASSNVLNVLEGVALNAAAATRTINIPLGTILPEPRSRGFNKIRVSLFLTRTAYTTVTAQFSCSHDGTNFARLTTRTCADGACAINLQSDTRTTSVSEEFTLEYDVRGCSDVRVLLGGASAGASDLVDAQVTAIIGGE